jgi:hypothetical protein
LREDSRVDVLSAIVIFLFLAAAFDGAFRRGADSPLWEARWLGLGAAARARIVTAVYSRDALDALSDPEEIGLVAGYRRRQRRRRSYVELAASPFLIVGAALALTGLLAGSFVVFILFVYTLIVSLWAYLHDRQMDGRLRAVVEAEAQTAP